MITVANDLIPNKYQTGKNASLNCLPGQLAPCCLHIAMVKCEFLSGVNETTRATGRTLTPENYVPIQSTTSGRQNKEVSAFTTSDQIYLICNKRSWAGENKNLVLIGSNISHLVLWSLRSRWNNTKLPHFLLAYHRI